MKKIFFILSVLSSNFIHGQMQKGASFIGVGFNYDQNKDTYKPANSLSNYQSSKSTSFNSQLRWGRFITDKIVMGMLLEYNPSSMENVNNNFDVGYPKKVTATSKGTIVSAGIFARAYKLFGSKFGFFCQVNSSYFGGNNDNKTILDNGTGLISSLNSSNDKISGFKTVLRPGFVYFITNKIGLETSIGSLSYLYQVTNSYSNYIKTSTSTTNGLNMDFGLSTLYLGVNFYFGRKKV